MDAARRMHETKASRSALIAIRLSAGVDQSIASENALSDSYNENILMLTMENLLFLIN